MDGMDASAVTDTTQTSGGVAGVLNGAKIMLFVNNLSPNKQTLLAALTEASYTGYARQTATWSTPARNENNFMSTRSLLMSWQPTDGVTPNTIYGYAILNPAGTVLLAVELLPVPVGLVDAFSYLGIVSEYTPASSNPGQCTVVT
jgi:hypothetical protein